MKPSKSDVPSVSTGASRIFVQRSPGVEICILHSYPEGGLTFLVRMEQGARAQRHGHPGGEETFVLSGKYRLDRRVDGDGKPVPDASLVAGDHVFAPPGEEHESHAEEATMLLVVAPGGIARPRSAA